MVVPMLDFAYQLQILAFQRWVYSGEAQQYEVYGLSAADSLTGGREPVGPLSDHRQAALYWAHAGL